jgi:intracellular septation protein
MTSSTRPEVSPLTRMAIDIGPLLVFFIVNFLTPGPALFRLLSATAAFMVAISVAMAVSYWKTRHISPMLWFSGALVLVFGGLALYFHDDWFIKVKPTIIYCLLAGFLGYGLLFDKPVLELVLGKAYPGLSNRGWRLLTINWLVFFLALAVANEVVRTNFSNDVWAAFKFPGVLILTFVFAGANIPMLMKHGLQLEKPKDEQAADTVETAAGVADQ